MQVNVKKVKIRGEMVYPNDGVIYNTKENPDVWKTGSVAKFYIDRAEDPKWSVYKATLRVSNNESLLNVDVRRIRKATTFQLTKVGKPSPSKAAYWTPERRAVVSKRQKAYWTEHRKIEKLAKVLKSQGII